ncbi:MAG: G5 domain-containing protein [Clostridia bacterium]|nr:G5 domain-containing protein [Clostridia bacterium]
MNAVKKLMQSKTRLFVILGLLITTISIAATTYFTLAFASSAEISILDANNAVLINTSEKNVQAILTEAGIQLNPDDTIYPALTEEIGEDGQIVITRIKYEEAVEKVAIPYDSEEVKSSKYELGTKTVTTGGENGIETITYKVKIVNGKEATREEIAREITLEPVTEIVAVGTKVTTKALDTTGADYILCTATAYDGSYETLGYYNPKTALGRTPTVGTVAVDPKVIPLGKKLYIESVDGSYVYGECFAGDTGGAIKGNRVDLFMASRSEALAFGRRQVKVYILD